MKKKASSQALRDFLAIVLTLCLAFPLLPGLAEGAPDSEQPALEKLREKIIAFEQGHPELKELLPVLTGELHAIHQEEMRTAFTGIRARFEEMLEAERENGAIPDLRRSSQ